MKIPTLVTFAVPALGAATTSFEDWHPAGLTESRGPCPGLNTLSNHGFLPRSGRNITMAAAIDGLAAGFNWHPSVSTFFFSTALKAIAAPGEDHLSLDQLGRHNILEHDGSLSRSDYYFGGNWFVFNQSVFDRTLTFWDSEIITTKQLAAAREFRKWDSRAYNPNYTYSAQMDQNSVAEVSSLVATLGNWTEVNAKKSYVEYLFRNERLPTKLGWKVPEKQLTMADVGRITGAVARGTTNPCTSNAEAPPSNPKQIVMKAVQ